jgi:hypothetical protein
MAGAGYGKFNARASQGVLAVAYAVAVWAMTGKPN